MPTILQNKKIFLYKEKILIGNKKLLRVQWAFIKDLKGVCKEWMNSKSIKIIEVRCLTNNGD